MSSKIKAQEQFKELNKPLSYSVGAQEKAQWQVPVKKVRSERVFWIEVTFCSWFHAFLTAILVKRFRQVFQQALPIPTGKTFIDTYRAHSFVQTRKNILSFTPGTRNVEKSCYCQKFCIKYTYHIINILLCAQD